MEVLKCAGTVQGRYHGERNYPCSYYPKFFEDGKWWCTVHRPSAVRDRRAKADAKWRAKVEATRASEARAAKTYERGRECAEALKNVPNVIYVEAIFREIDSLNLAYGLYAKLDKADHDMACKIQAGIDQAMSKLLALYAKAMKKSELGE